MLVVYFREFSIALFKVGFSALLLYFCIGTIQLQFDKSKRK